MQLHIASTALRKDQLNLLLPLQPTTRSVGYMIKTKIAQQIENIKCCSLDRIEHIFNNKHFYNNNQINAYATYTAIPLSNI